MAWFKVHYLVKALRGKNMRQWQVLEAESADDARAMFESMDSDFRFSVTHVESVQNPHQESL